MSSSDIESKAEECGTKGTNHPSPCKKVESSARLSVSALLDAAELAFTNETGLRRLANLSGPGSMAFSLWLATKKYNNWLVQEEASLTQNVKEKPKKLRKHPSEAHSRAATNDITSQRPERQPLLYPERTAVAPPLFAASVTLRTSSEKYGTMPSVQVLVKYHSIMGCLNHFNNPFSSI